MTIRNKKKVIKRSSPDQINKQSATSDFSLFNKKTTFPIVGIGASAGGLEAFELFFEAMPPDSGMAFILVSHLDPSHTSILPELIQKKTSMNVLHVADHMQVQPDHVYVIPPGKEMAILNGYLKLMEVSGSRGTALPIDSFFRSLAQDQRSNAVCIIFSGTGTDGTLGLRAIKGEAGMAMVQDEKSAKYDGMPRNAIATGLVDYILPPAKMPEQLISFSSYMMKGSGDKIHDEDDKIQNALQKIFILLRSSTNHDFSQYKKNTIFRRIERRMHVHQIVDITSYVRYLQESERERHILFKDLLIGVTSFFRDGTAFELLKEKYLPVLFEGKPDEYQVRIWVPGCSSGEEVYSIAMIARECMEMMDHHYNIQIFGTDIDEEAINIARAGIYPDSIVADVSPERLKSFFIKDEHTYQIKKVIREMVVFATQNIIKDPPFTRLDMLCCRNLLIYFTQDLQKLLFPIFHYSLKKDGILFLGSSETTGYASNLFTCLDKKWKFFTPIASANSPQAVPHFPLHTPLHQAMSHKQTTHPKVFDEFKTQKLLKSIIAQSDLPACVVIDDQANIIYIHGRTGHFLEPAEGEISTNLLAMARHGIKTGLTNAIHKVLVSHQETVIKGLHVKTYDGLFDVNLIVRPLPDLETGSSGIMMVIFEPVSSDLKPQAKHAVTREHEKGDEYEKLEHELQYTKENLQSTIEELETSNEELMSANEELQSTNEELQSTNEELETSKEELQSLNEESTTVNSELQSRIDELIKANDDIKNLLDATEIATIFLDINFELSRFTSTVKNLFPLKYTDIGRPIKHFSSTLVNVDLQSLAAKVLEDLNMIELEVNDNKQKTYRMRLRPYRTINNVIDGVVITFEDITQIKLIEAQLEASSFSFEKKLTMMSKVFMDSADPIIIEDLGGTIIDANSEAINSYGWSREEIIGKHALDLSPKENYDQMKNALDQCLKGTSVRNLESSCLHKSGKFIPVLLTFSLLSGKNGKPQAIATIAKNYPAS
ncbi:chemotaxis protein CheB [Desulfogranum marinum]|uniref:chemotaxis protein CheB n=1 Tax=Desulfogranum marinum TaxID=453220 RepID=UPI001965CAE3|nr:chemotaxis protein CheB [Desulfogranum marinum]MBM9514014.1 PAS domain-containing protein [Desulfogranum marinum]